MFPFLAVHYLPLVCKNPASFFIFVAVHLLLLNLALIGGVAGIGLAHLRGNILLKVLPSAVTADQDGVYSSELPSHSHSQTMHQFKEM